MRLGGDDDDRIPADERGREPRDEAAERGLVGREERDDPGRLREGEVEVRPATGFEEPITCASLSAHPAYQTTRSIAASTSFLPEQTAARSAVRASIISARR